MDSTDVQRELFETFMESQYWPREQIEEYQRKRLQRLLRHARSHVPFYRDRLADVVDDAGRVDWSRWDDVPILTRADIMAHGQDMVSTLLPPGHGRATSSTTSGSTGAPISVLTSGYASLAARAARFRNESWHGLNWSKDVLFYTEERDNSGVWPNVEVRRNWGPEWLPQSTGRHLRFNGDTSPSNILEFIASQGIRYLSCRAKVAQVLAIECERLGLSASLDAVLAFSTATHEDEREDISRVFGAKVLSFYSSKEAQLIAYQCPAGDHLHINEELALVELLGDDGRPVAPRSLGRVVVTNLFNWAQPLIRYEQGDLAVEGEPCSCGRTLRVLERIAGRVTDMFRFPDGSAVAFALPENTKRQFNIKAWQVAQIGPLHLEVRYQPMVAEATDEIAIATAVRARTHPDASITFKQTDDFLHGSGKKFSEYVNEYLRQAVSK
jgi:phenylacetate-CoA ligase